MKRRIGLALLGVMCCAASEVRSQPPPQENGVWEPERARRLLARVRADSFDILRSPELRDYTAERRFGIPSLAVGQPLAKRTDEEGIPIFTRFGEAGHYHPSFLASRVLWLLDAYRLATDEEERKSFLALAIRIADKLEDNAVQVQGAYFFLAHWDRVRHGYLHKAPRASGMTQGLLLQVFSSLYRVTGTPRYKELAEKTFRSLFFVEGEAKDGLWVSTVDDDDYLWIELYPKSPPSHTMNGFIFAVFGIHEYYDLSHDKRAKRLLMAALTTLRDKGGTIRNVGDISSKSVQYRHNKPRKYHRVHIWQFLHLYRITGDPAFFRLARQFQDDLLAYDAVMSKVHAANEQAERGLGLACRLFGVELDRSALYPLKKSYEAWGARESFGQRTFKEIRSGKRTYYTAIRNAAAQESRTYACDRGSLLGAAIDDWSRFVEMERALAADIDKELSGGEEPWAIRSLLSRHLHQELGDASAFLETLRGYCAAEEGSILPREPDEKSNRSTLATDGGA